MIYWIPSTATPEERCALISACASVQGQHPAVKAIMHGLAVDHRDPRSVARGVLERVWIAPVMSGPASTGGEDLEDDVLVILARGGECKRKTLAVMALDLSAGLIVRAVYRPQRGQALAHVAPQVWLDGAWVWSDATRALATLGAAP